MMKQSIRLLILVAFSHLIPEANVNAQNNSADDYIRVEIRGKLNQTESGSFIRSKKSSLQLQLPESGPYPKLVPQLNGQAVVIHGLLIENEDHDWIVVVQNLRRVEHLALLKASKHGGLAEVQFDGMSFKTIADLEKHVGEMGPIDEIEFKVDVKLDPQHMSNVFRVFVEHGVTRIKQTRLPRR